MSIKSEYTETEQMLIENSAALADVHGKTGFQYYQALREFWFGKILPLKVFESDQDEIQKIEEQIDFVKSLGFINEHYIDNFILYVEVLKSPVLSKTYLQRVIDKHIQPSQIKAGIKQFHLLTSAVLTYKLVNDFSATARTCLRIMELHYGYNYSELEAAYAQCKRAYEELDNSEEIESIIFFITFWLLYEDEFEPENFGGRLGSHHHTQKAHKEFVSSYHLWCDEVACRYIQNYRELLQRLPDCLSEILTKDCRDKISLCLEGKSTDFETNEVLGVLLVTLILSIAPNLASDEKTLKEFGLFNDG